CKKPFEELAWAPGMLHLAGDEQERIRSTIFIPGHGPHPAAPGFGAGPIRECHFLATRASQHMKLKPSFGFAIILPLYSRDSRFVLGRGVLLVLASFFLDCSFAGNVLLHSLQIRLRPPRVKGPR